MPVALEGLRVLELATGVSGPYCGKLLAGLGADVIKLEPTGGDATRGAGPFPRDIPDPERSGLFLHLNTGKRSQVSTGPIDGLLAEADVWPGPVAPAGRVAAAGLDPAGWRARYPCLVIASVTTFGPTGPYADYAGRASWPMPSAGTPCSPAALTGNR